MKFNLKTNLVDYEGKVMTEIQAPGPGYKPGDELEKLLINMRQVITAAVRRDIPGTPTTPEDKQRIYGIMTKIWKRWSVDLSHQDCEFIMARARETLDDLMLGRLEDFLEQREPEIPAEDGQESET